MHLYPFLSVLLFLHLDLTIASASHPIVHISSLTITHAKNPLDISKRQQQAQFPEECTEECAAISQATSPNCNFQCGCTEVVIEQLPACQACLVEVQRDANAKTAIGAIGGDGPETPEPNLPTLPTAAEIETACANAGFPIGGSDAAVSSSSSSAGSGSSSIGSSSGSNADNVPASSANAGGNGNAGTGSSAGGSVSPQGQNASSSAVSVGFRGWQWVRLLGVWAALLRML